MLKQKTNEIDSKGTSTRSGYDEILSFNGITYHFIAHCYWHVISTLARFGQGRQALSVAKIMCDYEFYSKLSEEQRQVFHKEFQDRFPQQYIAFNAFILNQHDEKIRQFKRQFVEGEIDINYTLKAIYQRWYRIVKNIDTETEMKLKQTVQPFINFVHLATFSLEKIGELSMKKAVINMEEMTQELSSFTLVCFFAGLESQYHESKRNPIINSIPSPKIT